MTLPKAPSTTSHTERSFVQLHRGVANRVARRQGVAPQDVDDVLQRVFLTVLSKRALIQSGAESAFVAAVTRREAAHMRRTYVRRCETTEDAVGPLSSGQPRLDDLLQRRLEVARVLQELSSIDTALAEALIKSSVYGWSCQQIAHEDGVPVGTIKSRIRRARLELRQKLAATPGTSSAGRGLRAARPHPEDEP